MGEIKDRGDAQEAAGQTGPQARGGGPQGTSQKKGTQHTRACTRALPSEPLKSGANCPPRCAHGWGLPSVAVCCLSVQSSTPAQDGLAHGPLAL